MQVFKAAWSRSENDRKIEFHGYFKAVLHGYVEGHQEPRFLQ